MLSVIMLSVIMLSVVALDDGVCSRFTKTNGQIEGQGEMDGSAQSNKT